MSGYTRQSSSSIIPTEVVRAAPLNAEFNQVRDAFAFDSSGSTGHKHDGSSDEGSYVPLIADVDGMNKVQIGTDQIRFFVEVSSSSVEQFKVQDGLIVPVTNNDIDLGTSSLRFKDGYFAGDLNISGTTTLVDVVITGSLDMDSGTSATITGLSAPTTSTDAATKNYVDTEISSAVSDLVASAPGTLDTLNELAAALNDDPNFATTITTSIGTKLSLSGGTMSGNIDMASNKVINLGTPTSAGDAASKSYVDSILGSATSAADSATAAANSLDSFDDRYLGAKVSAPALDNDGDALITGALYWNSSDNSLYIWSGSAWNTAAFDTSNALISTNNLSDLDSVSTARSNLGLGTVATTDASAYATAAQGTKADNALPVAGGTMTGNLKTLELQETVVALSGTTPSVNLENGTVFTLSTSGNTTFTFTNPATTGTCSAFTLRLTAGGAHTITWPASVDWSYGTAPEAPESGETDVFVFFTTDGGTTWYGFQAGDKLA